MFITSQYIDHQNAIIQLFEIKNTENLHQKASFWPFINTYPQYQQPIVIVIIYLFFIKWKEKIEDD